MTGSESNKSGQRLDSWKEIAAYFDRDEKTVRRWEKEFGLPVYRYPGSRGRIYGFVEELQEWARSSRPQETEDVGVGQGEDLAYATAPSSAPSSVPSPIIVLPIRVQPTPEPDSRVAITGWRGRWRWFLLAAASLLLAVGFATWQIASGGRARAISSAHPAHTPVPAAEELYLRGRYSWNKRTPESLNQAVDYFTQAIVLDPADAKSYAGLADTYNLLPEYTGMSDTEAFRRAFAASSKAVELDDSSAEAHASLGFVLFCWKWDAAGAEHEFQRAIALNPNYAVALHWYSNTLIEQGRYQEALALMNRAQQLDPTSPSIRADRSFLIFNLGHRQEGIALLKQMESTDPGFASPHSYLSHIYLADLDCLNYLAEARQAATMLGDADALAAVGAAEKGFAQGGATAMLRSLLAVQRKQFALGRIPAFLLADTCALLGDKAATLSYLRESFRRREISHLAVRLQLPLRGFLNDPEFDKLLKQPDLSPPS